MATINVPADQPTIQAAITTANPGDTIVVAAGTFNAGARVVVNKTLTLLGAKADIDARTRDQTGESIIDFSPTGGSSDGVVVITVPNVIINGFFITSSGFTNVNTAAISTGTIGFTSPSTTNNVTGLQIINNIITNNRNGIWLASTEPAPLPVNYLIQYNFFSNNQGAGINQDGNGMFITNSGNNTMTNVTVSQNLFNGLESGSAIRLINVNTSTIYANVMNNDNVIRLETGNGNVINKNASFGATGVAPFSTTASALQLSNQVNIEITNNLLYNATENGINIVTGLNNATITGNCIVNNTTNGILFNGTASSNINASNNNIEGNTIGLTKTGAGTAGTLNFENNYWGSPDGPNYNGGGPGTGQPIVDNAAPPITFEPFLTVPITCPSPVVITKTSNTINVPPGDPVEYTYTINVNPNDVTFQLTSLNDPIPTLNSGNQWFIFSQNPPGFFTIVPGSPQILTLTTQPVTLDPAITYTVTIRANTNILDAGQILDNSANTTIQIGGIVQSSERSAVASVLICVHSTSQILMADGSKKKIIDVKQGDLVITGNGTVAKVVENVECMDGIYNRYYGACIIFEKDSLAPGIPTEKFAIDANHPIAIVPKVDLKPSRTFLPAEEKVNIYKTYWDAVSELLPGPNRRYDLILEGGSTYVANGVIVQSRKSHLEPGYDYNGSDYIDKLKK